MYTDTTRKIGARPQAGVIPAVWKAKTAAHYSPLTIFEACLQTAIHMRAATGLVRSSGTRKDNNYGSETIDRIGFCRRAGLQRGGGRYCDKTGTTENRGREARPSTEPQPCVDSGISQLGWPKMRMDRRQVGTAPPGPCQVGSPSLGSQERRLCSAGGALAIKVPRLATTAPDSILPHNS